MKKKQKKKIKILNCFILIIVIAAISTTAYFLIRFNLSPSKKLYDLDFSRGNVRTIESKLSEESINKIIAENKYNKWIIPFIHRKYFIENKLFDYISFKKKKPELKLDQIVELVNTNRDHYSYELIKDAKIELNEKVLVNKYYRLKENYIPELIEADNNWSYYKIQINKLLEEDFREMAQAAQLDQISLIINNAYVSYEELKNRYDKIVAKSSIEYADVVSFRPGHSELQTGLLIDILSKNIDYIHFTDSALDKWLTNNAYKFGFIKRYPENKKHITATGTKDYRYRYVGKDVAKIMKNEDLSFEEYYAYYIENKK